MKVRLSDVQTVSVIFTNNHPMTTVPTKYMTCTYFVNPIVVAVAVSLLSAIGFVSYPVLLLAGLKGVDSEVWKAAKVDGIPPLRFYLEVVIPMMKYTILTCIILLFMGVVKSYDIIVAMTNGGPGGHSTVPAYFILNAYFHRQNIGMASAGSTLMLLFVVILLLVMFVTNRILRRGDNR